jgi:hypothetical protein
MRGVNCFVVTDFGVVGQCPDPAAKALGSIAGRVKQPEYQA